MSATEESKHWSSLQSYTFALVCLVLGYVVGYLLHPPKPALGNLPPVGAMGGQPTPDLTG